MPSEQEGNAKKQGSGGGSTADALTPPAMQNDSQGEQTMKFVPGEQNTIRQVQNTIPAAPKTMPVAARPSAPSSGVPLSTQATFGGRTSGVTISNETGQQALAAGITLQDLINERLLLAAPRTESHGRLCPTLNGIPLLAKIGQGGMGAVYYGIHPRLRSEVAVKVLPFTLAEQDPGMIRRFFREAQIAAQVHSPHLVNVTDVNEECGLFFLVMEFVSGCTAGQYMKALIEKGASGLPEVDALTLTIAASEGLRAAHDNNVVHRDIKPENVMIPYQSRTSREYDLSRAKLMDLGLARNEDSQQSLTGAQAAMGTPGYMAPEQAMDAKSADKRSDVFSMGATLYALLTGRPPFKGETVMKVLMATMHEPHEPIINVRTDISPAVNDLLERCLAKKQENRYTDARQLLGALEDCRRLLTGATAAGGMSAPRTMVYGAGSSTPAPASMTPSGGTVKTVLGAAGATPTPASQAGTVVPGASGKKGLLYVGAGVAALVLLAGGLFLFGGHGGGGTSNSNKGPVGPGPKPENTATMDPVERERLVKRHTKLVNDAMESVKAGDPDEAKFTLGLAKGLSLEDQAARDREKQVETAIANIEKKKEFDKTLKDVEALVGKSDFQGAMTLLTQAIAKAPDDAVSAAKSDALDKKIRGELRKASSKDSAQKLLAEARGLLASKPGDALEKAQQAKKLVSETDELFKDAGKLEDQAKAARDEQQKNEQYDAIIKEVDAAFTAGKFEAASEKAVAAKTLIPSRKESTEWLKKIGPKLDEAEKARINAEAKRQRDQKLAKALADANQQFTKGDLDAALGSLKLAYEVDAEDAAAKMLEKRVLSAKAEKEKSEAEQTKLKTFSDLRDTASRLADAGADLEDAAKLVGDARKIFPDDKAKETELQAIEKKIGAKREAQRIANEYEGLLAKAKEARGQGDLAEATAQLQKALASPVADDRAQKLKQQLDDLVKQREDVKNKEVEYDKLVKKGESFEQAGDGKGEASEEKIGQYELALTQYGTAKSMNLKAGGPADQKETAVKRKIADAKAALAEVQRKKLETEQKRAAEAAALALKKQKFDTQISMADGAAKQGDFTGAQGYLDAAKAILPNDQALAAKAAEYKKLQDDSDKAIRLAFGGALEAIKKGPSELPAAIAQVQKACKDYPGRRDMAAVLDNLQAVQKTDAQAQQAATTAAARIAEFGKNKKLEGKAELTRLTAACDSLQKLCGGVLTQLAGSAFKDAPAVLRQFDSDVTTTSREAQSLAQALETMAAKKPPDDDPRPDGHEPQKDKPKPPKDTPKPKRGGSAGELDVFGE